ncbi:PREDICTED: high affinity cGMP-specific 3',5'-cyclic phosphodiesterase 9A-like [Amphimedon queenslandica]|uniref:Phosphodiesterase n=1 Tax=Amphimedon queenslandica TaxID=400682 RepID=A0A1X7UYY0_AMPQE|nr:PREDICTED: high affinity cGMP-specific 3',5'-cyclic phosphodiesterase 9A-like [Amphimedon queenslandica]|eukprot:XP_003386328.1 PREDICTED: high affinity cGMP-specific 3',5'-cyclic phosphodiesterase 9A-like [Amphimedon queenslandica]
MGNGVSSQHISKKIYLEVAGKNLSVSFSGGCSSQELKELIATGAGFNRWSDFTLEDHTGSLVPVSLSIAPNTPRTPYRVQRISSATNGSTSDREIVNEVLSRVSEEISRAFKSQDFLHDFSSRLESLEKRMEALKYAETIPSRGDLENYHQEMSEFQTHHVGVPSIVLKYGGKDTDSLAPVTYPKINLSDQALESLKRPSANIWDWEPSEMLCLIEHMFHELDLLRAINTDEQTLQQWLLAVQHKYRNNPFHNFRHCFCVTQMMYGMIHLLKLQDVFDSLDLVILLTSCICHDIDHPGLNNSYQINAHTELAIRYNDISPLENHHAAVTFQLLERSEYNIFSNVSKEDFKRLRSGIIELILATDMSKHSEIMTSFKGIQPTLDYNNNNHKKIIKQMLIKSCDISNEVRPTKVAEPWVDCLLEEYFRQSDIEKSTGLPVTPFMDRDKVTKPSAQIGFIKFVLIPMFETMVMVFPQLEDPVLKPLKESLEHYEHLKLLEDAKLEQ